MEQQISWLPQMLHSFPARSGAGELSDLDDDDDDDDDGKVA